MFYKGPLTGKKKLKIEIGYIRNIHRNIKKKKKEQKKRKIFFFPEIIASEMWPSEITSYRQQTGKMCQYDSILYACDISELIAGKNHTNSDIVFKLPLC